MGKMGRDAPAPLEFLCDNPSDNPSESAHLDLENMAKNNRGTIKQHNNK